MLHAARQPLTVGDCAKELRVSIPTLRRWLRDGAPRAVDGGRGRGNVTLLDVNQVRTWRNTLVVDPLAVATRRASRIPELIANAAVSTYLRAGADKPRVAQHLAAFAATLILEIEDELRDALPGLPATRELPEKIVALRDSFSAVLLR